MQKKEVAKIGTSETELWLSQLKGELANITKITGTQFKTSSAIDGFSTAIQDESKIENLVRMHASVMGRKDAYNSSQETLSRALGGSFPLPVFKINGYSPEDIESDIILRIQILGQREREEELKALIKEGEQFLTEADKFNMFKAKVAKAGLSVPQLTNG